MREFGIVSNAATRRPERHSVVCRQSKQVVTIDFAERRNNGARTLFAIADGGLRSRCYGRLRSIDSIVKPMKA